MFEKIIYWPPYPLLLVLSYVFSFIALVLPVARELTIRVYQTSPIKYTLPFKYFVGAAICAAIFTVWKDEVKDHISDQIILARDSSAHHLLERQDSIAQVRADSSVSRAVRATDSGTAVALIKYNLKRETDYEGVIRVVRDSAKVIKVLSTPVTLFLCLEADIPPVSISAHDDIISCRFNWCCTNGNVSKLEAYAVYAFKRGDSFKLIDPGSMIGSARLTVLNGISYSIGQTIRADTSDVNDLNNGFKTLFVVVFGTYINSDTGNKGVIDAFLNLRPPSVMLGFATYEEIEMRKLLRLKSTSYQRFLSKQGSDY